MTTRGIEISSSSAASTQSSQRDGSMVRIPDGIANLVLTRVLPRNAQPRRPCAVPGHASYFLRLRSTQAVDVEPDASLTAYLMQS